MKRIPSLPISVAVVTALAALAACDRSDRTAGQQTGPAVAQSERAPESARTDAQQGGAEVRRDGQQASGEVRNAVADAAITAAVNAQLARDSELSALRIDVDTSDGRVALRGDAPNREARDRATRLASGVDGVKSVDNQLSVKS